MPELDVTTFGEALAVFDPRTRGSLRDVRSFEKRIGGAEVNVAVALARLGHRVGWAGRVGLDALGDEALAALRAEGVDVSHAARDPRARTGLYVKELRALGGVRAHYFRADTAASRIGPADLDVGALHDTRIVYLTGITAAISDSSRAAAIALLDAAAESGVPVCFDVNLRWALLGGRDPRALLAPFLERADLILAAADEARLLFGSDRPEELCHLEPSPAERELVVHDRHGAFAVTAEGVSRVAARPVDVVDPVGAGDAFAAGYLSGRLRGWEAGERLRLAEVCAAAVIAVPGDHAGALNEAEALADLGELPILER